MNARQQPHAWVSIAVWWHAAFAAAAAVTVVLTCLGPGSRAVRGGALACVGVLVVLYVVFGARCVDPDSDDTRGTLWRYAGPAVVVMAVGLLLSPGLFSMMFILPPQFFAAAPAVRDTVPTVGLLLVAGAVGQARWVDPPFGSRAWTQAIGQFAVIGLFSFGMGVFIMRIIDQSRERAALIDELMRTRADLDVAQHEAGVQAERQRLAHDIHDTLAQGFTSIVLLAQTAAASSGADGPMRASLAAIEDTARQNLAEARALVAELTPPALASSSLGAAGGRLVEQLGREIGLDASWAVEGEPRALPADAEVALLRALQEALANVRRHAQATSVRASLSYGADGVRLVVRDDGVGFTPDAPVDGYGLRGMRSRIEQVGGSLRVSSSPGGGTQLEASVVAP